MRVLHINAGNLYGGVETILMTLARNRDIRPQMESHFALCFADRLSQELSNIGAHVYLLGNVRVSRPLTVWRARRALATLLQTKDFDVIVCHSAWPHAIFAPVVRAARKPLVFWLHNRTKGQHWSERWARLSKPDLVLCVSRSTAETAANIFPDVQREVFYSPLPLPESIYTRADRTSIRAELDTPDDATVIIQVSRLESWKGHLLHLEALGRLLEVPGWVCWQVGGAQRPDEADYLEQLKCAVRRLGLADRVRFLGQRSDVPRLLAAADLFCQPSRETEGFSISFMEAFLAHLPIITTAIGGALEIVQDSSGILIPVDDVTALTVAIRRLLQDAALRVRFGENGYRRVWELCDPTRQMNTLGEIFAKVVSDVVPA